MISLKFGFRSGKYNHDWRHQLSSLTTGWIHWKLHDIGGPSHVQTQDMKQEDLHIVCFARDSLLPDRYFVIFNHC